MSQTQIKLTWNDVANEQNYDLWRVPSGGSWQKVATLSANTVSYNDPGLSPETWYKYAIRAYAGSVSSGWTYSAWVMTPGAPVAAPTNFAGSAVSQTEIRVTWNDVANEQNYDLWRVPSGGSWQKVATLSANTVAYNDSGLSPETWYRYAIRAYRGSTSSSWVYSSWIYTPGEPIAAPTFFFGTAVSSSQINLAWNDVYNEQNYDLWRVPSGGSWQKVATLPANTTSYNDSGLVSETWYKYAIRAYRGSTTSVWTYSNWIKTP